MNHTLLNRFFSIGSCVVLSIFFLHCPKPKELSNLLNERIKNPYDTTQILNIGFATNRIAKPNSMQSCNGNFFSNLFGEGLRYGSCLVNVPSSHSIGSLDYNMNASRDKFFAFLGLKSYEEDAFFQELEQSTHDEILLFVHGFNVGFEEAILRGAQIHYDVKFQGKTIVFTWPAGNKEESLLSGVFIKDTYQSNYQDALASRKGFRDFLHRLDRSKKKIHLIVHSMGHQVVLPALAEMAGDRSSPLIQELILNAPDFDSQDFGKIREPLIKISHRVTLYCSPGDNALVASQKVNGGRRAGMCVRYQGMDVINVNEVDDPVMGVGGLGHGYYSSRPILTDIHQVLLGVEANKRLFVRTSGPQNGEHYVLRK